MSTDQLSTTLPSELAALIDGTSRPGAGDCWHPVASATGQPLSTSLRDVAPGDLDDAVSAATRAFRATADDHELRARLLGRIADLVDAELQELVELAMLESGLSRARLVGEVARTSGQLRLMATAVRGYERWDLVIDPATADQPDVRRMMQPIGPVAVFEASNFPFAFGVLGGDTASALAAGCPVVVKAHPAHPLTADRCGRIAVRAVAELELDPGWFALVHGRSTGIGTALVQAPGIQAVAFTGSLAGGHALVRAAGERERPIPVYAEMGSLNPLVVLPGATTHRLSAVADALCAGLLGSGGQLCTKPGLVVLPAGDEGEELLTELGRRLEALEPVPLLTPQLAAAFESQVNASVATEGVQVIARQRQVGEADSTSRPGVLVRVSPQTWQSQNHLHEEHFGPFGVAVLCTPAQRTALLDELEGTLAASVWLPAGDDSATAGDVAATVAQLTRVAGRVVVDATSAGLRVGRATQHGGPWPATSGARDTSVGTASIDRFLRGICFQGLPDSLLPDAVRDANPLGLQRQVGGVWTDGPVTRA